MCHSRADLGKIKRLHERCLRLIYSDKTLPFDELLERKALSLFTTEISSFLVLKCTKRA